MSAANKQCTRCRERPQLCKDLCNRCYQASAKGGETTDEALKRRNFIRAGVGVLTGPNGEEWIVDAEDFSEASLFLWWDNGKGYAKGGTGIYLHRLLLPGCAFVDHRDRNRRNNRQSNLRSATRLINNMNKTCPDRGAVPRGIHAQRGTRWEVRIQYGKKRHYGGMFDSVEEAIVARNALASRLGISEYFE